MTNVKDSKLFHPSLFVPSRLQYKTFRNIIPHISIIINTSLMGMKIVYV